MSGEGNNEASGGGLIRGGAMDGDAINQRGEGAGDAELSTPGREVGDWWAVTTVPRVDVALMLKESDDLRERVADLERALADADGCRQLALGRALQAEARVADMNGYCAALAERLVPGHRGLLATAVEATLARVAEIEAERDAMRARLAELEAAARWVPVMERLPESGTTVLAMIDWPAGVATSPPWVWLCKFNLQRFRLCDGPFDWNMTSRVTHWRHLPAGPEVQP